jgi:transposase
MGEAVSLSHERVDDLPLLIGLMQRWGLPQLLDRHLGRHGLHQGLSNGWLATVWLAYILSEGDHCKASVEDWAGRHHGTLERLLGQSLRPTEFTDDRLAILLRRFSAAETWHAIESDLWERTLSLWQVRVEGVRLDATTTYGFHTLHPDGLLQVGHSKDHHPELGQVRVMAAAVQPSGHLVGVDLHPGSRADDPCYLPLYERVRTLLGEGGRLYAGDCKMAALEMRAACVAQGDDYLVPLPAGVARRQLLPWLEAAATQAAHWQLIWRAGELLGAGWEQRRSQCFPRPGPPGDLVWEERVLVVRSLALAHQEQQRLEAQLDQAVKVLLALAPPRTGPGRRRVFGDAAALQGAITAITDRYEVSGLLRVRWQRQERTQERQVGPGRPSPQRARRRSVQVRYQVIGVERDAAAVEARREQLGWRCYATSAPPERLSLTEAVVHYRGGGCLEREFHLLKAKPLGIRPLYVRREDQLRGLIHLLTVGLRLLSLLEGLVREAGAGSPEEYRGLYPGQPARAVERPTAGSLLRAVARTEITLTRIQRGAITEWHLTPRPSWLERLLTRLGLPPSLYGRLAENSS